MKIFNIPLQRKKSQIGIEIIYTKGDNAKENFEIIDSSKSNDIWFHIEGLPCAHIIATIPDCLNKVSIKEVIKKGAILCKQQSKYNNNEKLMITYTNISNVVKTDVL
jgi:predicted ribosome quality control (RQC) complex YloA/Tae2 family protein